MVMDAEKWERELLLEALDAYERGLSDAPYLRKWGSGLLLPQPAAPSRLPASALEGWSEVGDRMPGRRASKVSDGGRAGSERSITGGGSTTTGLGIERGARADDGVADGPGMEFVASTDDVDRHGDVVSVKGWVLDAYRRNPVFLWAHDYTRPAIGRAAEVWREEHSLIARIEFGPTDFARQVADLYRRGYQRGVSVGFRPLDYEMRRDMVTGEVVGIHFIKQELLEISAAPVPANGSALRKALDDAPLLRGYYDHRGYDWHMGYHRGEPAIEELLEILRSARQ